VSLANPTELLDAPELAILAVLDETLQQTIYALFAAHPELVSGDSLEAYRDVTPEAWLADAIYNHANALQYAIERYRGAVERARSLRNATFETE
jgi:hypothetical protein